MHVYFALPQFFFIALYDRFETVDFFFDLDFPLLFLALMLLTSEFFTPSLFFFAPVFFAAFFPAADLLADFLPDFLAGFALFFAVFAITFWH